MTTNVVSEMAEKWLPLPPERFFTAQRAPDMWCGDELPPTLQDEMRSPLVTQSKAMLAFQVLQTLARNEQRSIVMHEQHRRVAAQSRIGKRGKTKRH